jgi:hypothetical protein
MGSARRMALSCSGITISRGLARRFSAYLSSSTDTEPPEQTGEASAADVEGEEKVGGEESGIIKVDLTIPTSKDSSRESVGVGTSSADAGLPHEADTSGEDGPEEHNAIVPHPSFASHAELTYDWIVGPVTPDISSTSVLGRQQSVSRS